MTAARAALATLAALALLAAATVRADTAAGPAAGTVELRSASVRLVIDTRGGLPSRWLACAGPCDSPGTRRQWLVAPGTAALEWFSDQGADAVDMAARGYTAVVSETPDAFVAVLTSIEAVNGRPLVQRYELSRTTHQVSLHLALPPGIGLRLASGAGFVPPQLPGFGAAFSDVDSVYVDADGQQDVGPEDTEVSEISAARDGWLGLRTRFWTWLARPSTEVPVVLRSPDANQRVLLWRAQGGALDLAVYGGPVEWKSLRVVDAALTGTLFASLWEPLRWLCFALLFLLGFISSQVGNAGLAIILLSLAVKFLLYPLTRIADAWQADVNRAQSRIQPRLDDIRRRYRGEEAHKLTLQVYREERVHPLYTLKSLAGFAIQVPMFIAAFDMLAGNFALDGAGFLWIADLAAPDRLARLPVALPFFGADLNLLPLLMTAVTILSALTQSDASLSPALQARQRRNLYLMAGGFFLLFYTFPAGMVLYWTANNVWHLLKVQLARLAGRPG